MEDHEFHQHTDWTREAGEAEAAADAERERFNHRAAALVAIPATFFALANTVTLLVEPDNHHDR